jgi:hypothetical protein
MDVHAKSTVWCLVDQQGEMVREGKVTTSAAALTALGQELGRDDEGIRPANRVADTERPRA